MWQNRPEFLKTVVGNDINPFGRAVHRATRLAQNNRTKLAEESRRDANFKRDQSIGIS